ncbi:MAG: hypothetical protein ACTSXJ_04035 [Candidatus Baldrarchaeia archaeon]
MAKVKEKILELLKEGPKTAEEIISSISGTKPGVIKGLLTKMAKKGEIKKVDDKYSLP